MATGCGGYSRRTRTFRRACRGSTGPHWSPPAIGATDVRQPDPGQALAGLSDEDLAARLIDALERVNIVRAQDGQQPPNNPAVLDWLANDCLLPDSPRRRTRSLLKKAAGPGVFAGFAFDELG